MKRTGLFGWSGSEKVVPVVIQEAQHYRLADWPPHLDKLFCGEAESETNNAALGLACKLCHSNTFLSRDGCSILVLLPFSERLVTSKMQVTQIVCATVFGPNRRSCSNSYSVGFCKHEKIKQFSTPPILIQLHPFKHRWHYKMLASLKDQIFCLVLFFFKRNSLQAGLCLLSKLRLMWEGESLHPVQPAAAQAFNHWPDNLSSGPPQYLLMLILLGLI